VVFPPRPLSRADRKLIKRAALINSLFGLLTMAIPVKPPSSTALPHRLKFESHGGESRPLRRSFGRDIEFFRLIEDVTG
jgi:hypothetical protein